MFIQTLADGGPKTQTLSLAAAQVTPLVWVAAQDIQISVTLVVAWLVYTYMANSGSPDG